MIIIKARRRSTKHPLNQTIISKKVQFPNTGPPSYAELATPKSMLGGRPTGVVIKTIP